VVVRRAVVAKVVVARIVVARVVVAKALSQSVPVNPLKYIQFYYLINFKTDFESKITLWAYASSNSTYQIADSLILTSILIWA
jgi:hypothetical protein